MFSSIAINILLAVRDFMDELHLQLWVIISSKGCDICYPMLKAMLAAKQL